MQQEDQEDACSVHKSLCFPEFLLKALLVKCPVKILMSSLDTILIVADHNTTEDINRMELLGAECVACAMDSFFECLDGVLQANPAQTKSLQDTDNSLYSSETGGEAATVRDLSAASQMFQNGGAHIIGNCELQAKTAVSQTK